MQPSLCPLEDSAAENVLAQPGTLSESGAMAAPVSLFGLGKGLKVEIPLDGDVDSLSRACSTVPPSLGMAHRLIGYMIELNVINL